MILFWIELARCCKDMLEVKGAIFVRNSEYSHTEIESCVDKVHENLMCAISDVNETMRASVEMELNRPNAVIRASVLHATDCQEVSNMPTYAPPPRPSVVSQSGSLPVTPPPPVPSNPCFHIGEDDDDLEVVTVVVPPVPSTPPRNYRR